MMETFAKKLIIILAALALTSCAADRKDSAQTVKSTRTVSKPQVVNQDGYKIAKGSVKIDGVTVNFDEPSKSLNLKGRVEFSHVKSGAPESLNINLVGTVDAEGFAVLKSVDSQNETVKVAAKATCLGSEGDCHSSFIDIYIQADGVVYHHQVESIADDFGNADEEFDPSMATEGGNDGVEDGDEGGFIGDLTTDIESLFNIPRGVKDDTDATTGGSVNTDPELEKIKAEAEAAKKQALKAQEELKKAQEAAEKARKEAEKAKQEAQAAKAQVEKTVSESQKVKEQLQKSQEELDKAKKEALRAKALLEQAEQAKKQGEEAKAKQLADEAKKAQVLASQSEAAAKKAQAEAAKKQAEIEKAKLQAEKEQKAREAAAKAKEDAEKKAELAAQEKAKLEAQAKAKAEEEARRKAEAEERAKQNSQGSTGSGPKDNDSKSNVQVNKISQAIGAVNKGRLEKGINLKDFFGKTDSRGVDVIRPERKAYYATNELTHILDMISKMSYTLTPGYKSSIGDVSREKGGKLFKHKSHQIGVDADVAFYFKNKTFQGYLASAVMVNKLHPDWMYEQQWTMFKKIQETGFIDRIFIHPLMKKKLCEHAIKLGELTKGDSKSLAAQTLRRLIPEKDHHDHYHLRVKCSSAQARCRQMAEPPQGSGCF